MLRTFWRRKFPSKDYASVVLAFMTKWVIVMAMAASTVAPKAYRAAMPVENFPRLYLSLLFVCVNGGWTTIRIINDRMNTHTSAITCRNTAEASTTSSFDSVGAGVNDGNGMFMFRSVPACNTIGAGGGTRVANMGRTGAGAAAGNTGIGIGIDAGASTGTDADAGGAASKLDAVSCNDVIHGRVATFALDAVSRADMTRQCYCIQ